ncbi:MAG: NGG1p interacting factor NIF3 [Candidatus Geothermincolia bacterium]
MKLKDIYDLAIRMGIDKDPRGAKEIERLLAATAERHKAAPEKEKKYLDPEDLTNPFADTRILFGDPKTNVKVALVGIDMEVGEVLLADRLRDKGKPVDLIISHHPEGKALAALNEVMSLQADFWYQHGVPINVGEALIGKRMKEIQRGFLPQNHNRAIDVAALLGIPFVCLHTVADNQVTAFLTDIFSKRQPRTVGDVVDMLREQPEYQAASANKTGPTIISGAAENRAGKVIVDMTGGTEGPVQAIEKLAQAGVGTIVCMHLSEKHREEAEKQSVNVVVAGHVVSDSLGLNIILDELESGGVKIIPVSGFVRVSRVAAAKRKKK